MKKVVSLFSAAVILLASGLALADNYKLDPVHSFAIFRVKHNNTAYSYGRIKAPKGTISYDAAAPEKSTFEVNLDPDNIDMGDDAWENAIKSPTFLDTGVHDKMSFKSTAVTKKDDTHLEVTGDMTIHGVTKSITVSMEMTGTGKDVKGRTLIGFETNFTIKRSDYGVKAQPDMVGEEIRITISLEGIKQ